MEQNSTSKRLHSLDGLRGLAMIFVFLNHFSPKFIIAAFPSLDRIGLFSTGVTGVSFFFVLSGFLMACLYPQPHAFAFIQKRYTRIFPLFLTMCTAMLIFFLYPNLSVYLQVAIIVLLAIVTHIVWVFGIKKIRFHVFSTCLFFGFLFLQAVVGFFYAFWIMHHPPIIFSEFPPFFHSLIIGLVNATLTFPFGNYIPMLDGVYWSLASEILFYLIYPFFLVPLILFLIPQQKNIKIIFLLALLPLIGGIDIISHHIPTLSAFQFSLFYYFAGGILLGYLYRTKPQVFSIFSKIFKGGLFYAPLLLLFGTLVFEHYLNATIPDVYAPWIRLLSMFPFVLLVAIAIDKQTILYKFFSTKILVFIGTISYSLYLSHSAIIHILEKFHPSRSLQDDIFTILISFAVSTLVSSWLYLLLEKPYFYRSTQNPLHQKIKLSNNFFSTPYILGGILIFYCFAVFLSFQSQFSLSSLVVAQSQHVFSTKQPSTLLSLQNTNSSVQARVYASENDLGVISLSVAHYNPYHQRINQPMLAFSLSELGSKNMIISTSYVLDEFRGVNFPFGFPTIHNSKGKTYVATFTLVPSSNSNYAILDTTSLKAVYQIPKSTFFSNPHFAFSLLLNKLQNVFRDQLARITFLLLLPFALLNLFLVSQFFVSRKHN